MVDSIYFLVKGAAGFVLPIKKNIVYAEIDEGDTFGQSDISQAITDYKDENEDIETMFQKIQTKMKRQFTV